jgi:hypothetical protein
MAALAEALGQQLALHPQLEARIRAYFGANTTQAHLKMAETPTGGSCWQGTIVGWLREEGAFLCCACACATAATYSQRLPSTCTSCLFTPLLQARRCTCWSIAWRAEPCRPSPCCAAATSSCCPASQRCCRQAPTPWFTCACQRCSLFTTLAGPSAAPASPLPALPFLPLPLPLPAPQKKWQAVEAHLRADAPPQAPFRTALLRLRLSDETQVAAALERVAAAAGEAVQLGSYPVRWVAASASGAG